MEEQYFYTPGDKIVELTEDNTVIVETEDAQWEIGLNDLFECWLDYQLNEECECDGENEGIEHTCNDTECNPLQAAQDEAEGEDPDDLAESKDAELSDEELFEAFMAWLENSHAKKMRRLKKEMANNAAAGDEHAKKKP